MFDPFCCAYAPEKSVRRLIIGILKETVLPQLRVTAERFPELRVNLDSVEYPEARKSSNTASRTPSPGPASPTRALPWIGKLVGRPLEGKEKSEC